jgi:hypothetical protein
MMPYQSYQQWQIERPKTASEQYAADVRLSGIPKVLFVTWREPGAGPGRGGGQHLIR